MRPAKMGQIIQRIPASRSKWIGRLNRCTRELGRPAHRGPFDLHLLQSIFAVGDQLPNLDHAMQLLSHINRIKSVRWNDALNILSVVQGHSAKPLKPSWDNRSG